MAALASGQILVGRFSLVRALGRDGSGRVWLANDRELDESVVLKLLPEDAPEERVALLRRECRNARRLVHPAIVPVYEFHRGEDLCFITMAWIDGTDAGTLRGESPEAILRALLPVVDALQYAHGQGIVHRDVKPGNVLIDQAGRARLVDFGIAGLLAEADGGIRGGGSRYSVSPQQLDGAEPSPSDDVYATGVLLYELLSGRPPFWPAIGDERIRSEVPRPMETAQPLPPSLGQLVAAMLAKRPLDRPADMGQVRRSLEAALAALTSSGGASGGASRDTSGTASGGAAGGTSRDTSGGTAGGTSGGTSQGTSRGEDRAATREPPAGLDVRLSPPPRIASVAAASGAGGAATAHDVTRANQHRLTAAAIVLLVVVAAALFVTLPKLAESRRATLAAQAESPPPAGTPPTPRPLDLPPETAAPAPAAQLDPAQLAADAVARAADWFRRLDEREADRWGGEPFTRAIAALADARRAAAAGDDEAARVAADEAGALFEQVAASGVDALQRTLRDGQRALAAGNSIAAVEAFELAAAMVPESEQARAGLARARVLDRVVALLDRGEQNERRGEFQAAAMIYRQAAELDPLASQPGEALLRLDARLANDAFSRSMSQGLAALDRGDWTAARESFQAVLAIRPDAAGARDGLAQAEEGLRIEAIAHHQERAVAAEADENWRVAAEQYAAVLALGPEIRFAQDGRTRTEKRAQLVEAMERHLANPGRLQAQAVLDEATAVWAEAREIEPAGPGLADLVARMDRLLSTAASTVIVLLESDDATDVVVYKVGRLGTFTRHELTLRPGRYTAVGSRRGYRDVRLDFEVVAGRSGDRHVVRCEDAI